MIKDIKFFFKSLLRREADEAASMLSSLRVQSHFEIQSTLQQSEFISHSIQSQFIFQLITSQLITSQSISFAQQSQHTSQSQSYLQSQF